MSIGSCLLVAALAGCRGRERVEVHADPIALPDAKTDAAADGETLEKAGILVSPGRALLGADERFFRWAVPRSNTKYPQYFYLEATHEAPTEVQQLDLMGNETPIYVDTRWVVTDTYGFNVPDTVDLHDRSAASVVHLALACTHQDAIAAHGRVFFVARCPPRSAVSIFHPDTGDLTSWFTAPGMIDAFAVDVRSIYYTIGDATLHARSRSSGMESLPLPGFVADAFVVVDDAAFTCSGSAVNRVPLDGSPIVALASSCLALVGDTDGLAYMTDKAVFAVDAGSAQPRLVARRYARGYKPHIAITHAWVYWVAEDGIRRVPRH